MEKWKKTEAAALGFRAFHAFEKEWAVLAARRADGMENCMTVSWGGVGVLWGRPVAFYFVRPQRYTAEFLGEGSKVSLSFFSPACREALRYLGSHSGRDGDKVRAAGLSLCTLPDGAPSFQEADFAFSLRNLYADRFRPEGFLSAVPAGFYAAGDYHRFFAAEICGVFRNEREE